MVANLRLDGWQALHQRLCRIRRRRALLDAEEAQCLREAYAIQLWRPMGYVHMGEYLERELGYGPQVGAERLRVARALGELPQIESSLAEGALSFSAVRELTRIATADTEQAWLDEARGKNLRQIEALVAGRKRGDRPTDPTTPDLVNRVVRLELSPAAFALLRQAQGVLADEHGGRLDDSAFVEQLCRRAIEGDSTSDRPAHQIAYTVCESCDRAWQNGAGREIEVGPEVIERARCDAEWLGSLELEQPARVTTTVTPRLRRQIFARDHHRCTVPACRSARNLDIHHIEYQQDGGSHQQWNMTLMCTGHHQQLHDGTLTIRGHAPDALAFQWREPPGLAVLQDDNVPATDPDRAQAHVVPGDHAILVPENSRVAPVEGHLDIGLTHQHPAHATPEGDRIAWHGQRSVLRRTTTALDGDPPLDASRSGDTSARDQDARDALTTAGFKPGEARAAVETARPHVGDRGTLAQLVREALRCCAMQARG